MGETSIETDFIERPIEFAERVGVSAQCVDNWISKRMINGDAVVINENGRRYIAVRKAMAQLIARRDPRKAARQGKARLTLEGLQPRSYEPRAATPCPRG